MNKIRIVFNKNEWDTLVKTSRLPHQAKLTSFWGKMEVFGEVRESNPYGTITKGHAFLSSNVPLLNLFSVCFSALTKLIVSVNGTHLLNSSPGAPESYEPSP